MFEEMTDRIAGTLLTGLDVAVEFATLGEYRLVDPAPYDHATELLSPALPLVRRPARRAATTVAPDLLPKPATAVARASASRDAARSRPLADPPLRLRLDREGLRLDREALRTGPTVPGRRAVVPSAPRRRPGAPAKAPHAPARKRGGAVPSGTQLCLFNR